MNSKPWQNRIIFLIINRFFFTKSIVSLWIPSDCPKSKTLTTDHGHPERVFFSKISNIWAWADILGWTFLRHLAYFWPDYQHPFWDCDFLVLFFHYFNKKLSIYICICGIWILAVVRVANDPILGRITTLGLCWQSPLNLNQFRLTRDSKYGLAVFCIDLIVPGFVVCYVNSTSLWLNFW